MLRKILLVLTLLSFAEAAVLFWLAQETSWPFTAGYVLLSAVSGLLVVRLQGLGAIKGLRGHTGERVAGGDLLDGPLKLFAGILLILPGPITDVLALCLLLPPVRRLISEHVRRRIFGGFRFDGFSSGPAVGRGGNGRDGAFGGGAEGDIIDVEVRTPPPRARK